MPTALLERFIMTKRAAGCSPNTLYWYRMCISGYLAYAETKGCVEEYKKPDTIEGYLASLRSARKASSTVSGHFTAIAAWFNWLVQRRLLDDNPIRYLEKPKIIKRMKARVSKDEFGTLYRSIRGAQWIDHRDRCLLLVLFYSGLRLTECLNLRPTDIDYGEDVIVVERGKGDKTRLVPYHPSLPEEVQLYLAARPFAGAEYLFVSDDGHGRVRGQLTVGGLRATLERRFAAASLPYRNPHAFRHAFAMEFLNGGMEMSAVSAVMGHSSVTTTEREYASWLTAGIRREYNEALKQVGSPT